MALRVDATHARNYCVRTAEFHILRVKFSHVLGLVCTATILELQMAFLIPEVEDHTLYVPFY